METFALRDNSPLKMGVSKSIFGVHMHQKGLKPTMVSFASIFYVVC